MQNKYLVQAKQQRIISRSDNLSNKINNIKIITQIKSKMKQILKCTEANRFSRLQREHYFILNDKGIDIDNFHLNLAKPSNMNLNH